MTAQEVPDTGHAKLSASGASRWLACPGSVQLSQDAPDSTSEYAAEGTVAHHIAAECLIRPEVSLNDFLGQTLVSDDFEIEVTPEMLEAVQVYLDAIAADHTEGDITAVEADLTPALKQLHPQFGGTSDFIRYRPSTKELRVWDYKHGAGVFVQVEGNTQLKYYALGALLTANQPAGEVTVTIAQPRCMPDSAELIRSTSFHAVDLIDFAADLVEGAHKTEEPDPELHAGEHCTFCPARFKCPKLKEHQDLVLAADFDPVIVGELEPEKLSEALKLFPILEARIKQIREIAYEEAMKGHPPPGFKLVEKRAIRKWADQDAAEKFARQKAGEEAFTEPKLKSPAQLEKVFKKDPDAKKAMQDLVTKQSSGYTLAPEDDNRPAAQLASPDDFDSV